MAGNTQIKQAVILVGGEGTRLRPLTLSTPKSLVPILNVPFIYWMLQWLAKYGISEVVLSLGYLSNEFNEMCQKFAGELHIKIRQVIEEKPLGTAGAIKFAEQYLDEQFLVFNGDIFTQFNLNSFINAHTETNASLTIAVTPVDDPSQYGVVEHALFNNRYGRILRFIEKPARGATDAKEINAGAYIMKREVLNCVKPCVFSSLEREIFPVLTANKAPIYAYQLGDEYWIDIGTIDKYRQVHWDLLKNLTEPIVIGKSVSISSDAKIGSNVVLGDNVIIENGCHIKNSILWNGCHISSGASLNNVVLADGCSVTSGVILNDTVIPANEHIAK